MSKFRDNRLYEALDYLDEAYVAEVVESLKVPPAPGTPMHKRGQLRYILALAACLLLLSAAIPVINYVLRNYTDIGGLFTDDTTEETNPEPTEPETPAPETTVPHTPETSEDTAPESSETIYHETTEEPWPSTTAKPEDTTSPEETTLEDTTLPEPEYDGSQGLEYRVNDDGKGATLIGMGSCKDADIVVASFYKGYPVTDIEFAAFAGSTRITSITLSDSVLRVDYNTFSNCKKNLKHIYISKSVLEFGKNAFSFLQSLESITVSPENPRYYVEGNCLIDKETKRVLRGWGEFTIPSDGSVTSIAEGAFSCCNIVNVTVPNGITEIGGAAFAFCASLKSISLPEGLTVIGSSMFDSCESLESITLPDSVTKIDVAAFAYCGSLLNIRIGRNVEAIEKQAFYYSAVREIEFAGTVSEWKGIRKPDSWDENCFVTVIHCSDGDVEIIEYDGSRGLLYKINPDGKSAKLIGVGTNSDKSLIIATEYNGVPVTTIATEAFRNNTNVKSIYILGPVQYIGSEAFAFCTSLEKIVLPDSLISIGDGAFNGCTSLASINIPKGITEIGSFTFSECSSLKEITIPEGVTNIGEEAFYLCKNLKSVTLPSTLEYIRDWAFANCERLESIVIPDRVKWIGQRAFSDCVKLSSLTLGKGLEQIQENAFMNCTSLKSVTIPGKVIYFGNAAFWGCSALESVTLKKGVEMIGASVFDGCSQLSEIQYTGSVADWEKIGIYPDWNKGSSIERVVCSDGDARLKDTYDGTQGLIYNISKDGKSAFLAGIGVFTGSEIVVATEYNGLPVTAIAHRVINNAANLTSIYISKTITDLPDELFYKCNKVVSLTVDPGNPVYMSEGNCIIERKTGKLLFGCNASVIPDGVKVIGSHAFYSCPSLSSLTVPEGVEIIEDRAFANCAGLSSLALPESLLTVEEYAFYGCSSLKEISFGSKTKTIGDFAFSECTGLKNIVLPDTATLGERIFNNCSSLKSVNIPAAQTSLCGTFFGCSSLESVVLPDSLTSLLGNSFYGCTSLGSITLPASVNTINGGEFSYCASLTDFTYRGTVAEWNAINKTNWKDGAAFTSVKCADGVARTEMVDEYEAIETAREYWKDIISDGCFVSIKRTPTTESPFFAVVLARHDGSGRYPIEAEILIDRATGAVTLPDYSYSDIPSAIREVLVNKNTLIFVNHEGGNEGYFKDIFLWGSHFSAACDTFSYSVCDLDSDGKKEVILSSGGSILILREYNEKVYGYEYANNTVSVIFSDGSYSAKMNAGIIQCTYVITFEGAEAKSVEILRHDRRLNKYYVEGNEVTGAEYSAREALLSKEKINYVPLYLYPTEIYPPN